MFPSFVNIRYNREAINKSIGISTPNAGTYCLYNIKIATIDVIKELANIPTKKSEFLFIVINKVKNTITKTLYPVKYMGSPLASLSKKIASKKVTIVPEFSIAVVLYILNLSSS